jgi:hypothetical protein
MGELPLTMKGVKGVKGMKGMKSTGFLNHEGAKGHED